MSKRLVWLLQRGQKKMNEASVQPVSYSLHKQEALSSSNLPKLTVGCLTRYWMAFSYWKKHSETLDWCFLAEKRCSDLTPEWLLCKFSSRLAAQGEPPPNSGVFLMYHQENSSCSNRLKCNGQNENPHFLWVITRWDVWSIFDPLATS